VAIEAISREAAHGAALLSKMLEIALSELDLSPSQYRLLVFLQEAPAAATVLAARLDVTRPSLTALVDGLVARGLVVREPDPDDRRRVTHQISKAGRKTVARADDAIQTRLGQLSTNLAPNDRQAACTGLELWLDAIRTSRAGRTSQ
jgi:long-chain acyl-CoA synthetase